MRQVSRPAMCGDNAPGCWCAHDGRLVSLGGSIARPPEAGQRLPHVSAVVMQSMPTVFDQQACCRTVKYCIADGTWKFQRVLHVVVGNPAAASAPCPPPIAPGTWRRPAQIQRMPYSLLYTPTDRCGAWLPTASIICIIVRREASSQPPCRRGVEAHGRHATRRLILVVAMRAFTSLVCGTASWRSTQTIIGQKALPPRPIT
ncbi:hypothetical protein MRB53_038086 [Persea americana]|nr:hypothetical protein MRB53_038086 [Persea americana]